MKTQFKYLKWLIWPLWLGLLTLPFMGLRRSLVVLLALTLGTLLSKAILHFTKRFQFKEQISKPVFKIRSIVSLPISTHRSLFIILIFALLLFIPPFINRYPMDIITTAGIYVLLALGLNIVVGFTGLLVLGYIAFYAIGAYTYALLNTHFSIPFFIALPIGGLVAYFFGFILGSPVLRLRGDYLAIVTVGFGEITRLVLNNWDEVTRGPNGIAEISRPQFFHFIFRDPLHYYYLILTLVLITIFVTVRLTRSRIGRAWEAIREDEVAASAMGINVTAMKLLAFAISAAFAGVAGVFFAAKQTHISPESFTFWESALVLSMVVLGGMGSIPGVIIGALTLIILPELLRGFADYRMLLFGAGMVLMMRFRPQGFLPSKRLKAE
jgi:branched-chain amino acid transport system permease protein